MRSKQLFSPEIKLLIAACFNGVACQIGFPKRLALQPNVDWRHFLQLVNRHLVYAPVSKGLEDCELPPNVALTLRNGVRQTKFRLLNQVGELKRIQAQFDAQGIRLVVLKGISMSQALYGSQTFRYSKDLDLLVSAENLPAAQELLFSNGYQLKRFKQPLTSQQLIKLTNAAAIHLNFYHKERKINLELHWRFFTNPQYLTRGDQQAMINRALLQWGESKEVATLANEDLLLYLCLHGANHGWNSARWFFDIVVFVLCDEIEWNSWCERVKAANLQRPVAQVFALIHETIGIALPAEIERLISAEK